MKVIAKPTEQPTPERSWDYVAYVEGTEDENMVTELGATAQEAIDNFTKSHCPCEIDDDYFKCQVVGDCTRNFETEDTK